MKKWLSQWLSLSITNTLLCELRAENIEDYRRYLRIHPATYVVCMKTSSNDILFF